MKQVNKLILILAAAAGIPLAAGLPDPDRDIPAWPLEINEGLSATFGEYRPGRFHAGIDLKTRGETGYKVYAAAEGVVFRMKIRRRGYGNALYIRHPDNTVTVYAHLESFEDDVLGLESLAGRYRRERKTRYPGDIYPSRPIKVKKGQVIAYSGESGSGLPHLHFEMRIGEIEPVNPLMFSLPVEDDVPPVIEGILFEPADSDSLIAGRHGPLEREAGESPFTVCVRGKLHCLAKVYDSTGTPNLCGIYRIRLSRGPETVTDLIFDRFSYSNYREGGLIFDVSRSGIGPTDYTYRLTGDSRTTVPIVRKYGAPLDAGRGRTDYLLEVWDFTGNRSEQSFTIVGLPQIPVKIPAIERGEDGVYRAECVFDLNDEPGAAMEFQYTPDRGGTFVHPEIIDTVGDARKAEYYLGVPEGTEPTHFRGRMILDGAPFPWKLFALRSSGEETVGGKLAMEEYSGFLRFTAEMDTLPEKPLFVMIDGDRRIPMNYLEGTSFETAVGYDVLKRETSVVLVSGDRRPDTMDFAVHEINPAGDIHYENGRFKLAIGKGAAFGKRRMVTRITEARETGHDDLTVQSKAVRLGPPGLSFRRAGKLSMTSPGEERAGVYRWNGRRNKWVYAGGEDSPLETRFYHTAEYAILKDDSPPVITSPVPGIGAVLETTLSELRAAVKDIGSGVDYRTVKFIVNGESLKGEYDPDRSKLFLELENPLDAGTVAVELICADYAGNEAVKAWEFSIGR